MRGNFLKYTLFVIVTLLTVNITKGADDVSFEMSAPNVVRLGEQFRLTLTLNTKPKDIIPPKLDGFNLLHGPSTSSSSSVQYINGKMSSKKEYSFTYILSSQREGKFKIGAATANIDSKSYKSNTLNIEVVKGRTTQQSAGQQQSTNQASNSRVNSSSEITDKDLFINVNLNKSSVYKGEHIIAELKIYARDGVDISGFGDFTAPDFKGFWSSDISDANSRVTFKREAYKGDVYNVATLRKYILIPQQDSDITIDPTSLDVSIREQVASRSRGGFFGGFYNSSRTVNVNVKSKTVKVGIKKLPPAPESFSNGVGKFTLKSSISETKVKENDAITVTVDISGNGNIKLIQAPKIDLPSDFEVYDTQEDNNFKISNSGMRGGATFKYLFQPRFAGEYTIPPIELSYFDTKSGSYKTLKSQSYKITVEKGDGGSAAQQNITTYSKEDVKFIGQDIRYIKTKRLNLHKRGDLFFGSLIFYLIPLAGIILLILIYILNRKRIKDNSNIAGVKNKRANKIATKRLKVAEKYLKSGDSEKFYEEITKAIWGYISDKLTIPVSKLSKDSYRDTLIEQSVDTKVIDSLTTVIDEAEFARYAPGNDSDKMDKLYRDAASVILEMEREIKR